MRTLALFLTLAATALAQSKVVIVPIEDAIGPSTVYHVKRSLEQARAEHATLVVFEVNTPGGRVDSALDIANLIDKAGIPTAAWVKGGNFGGAQSAGALISIATGRIVMDPAATIGSAHPVDSSGTLASEKVVSWVAATFRAWAEKKGLPPLVAAGMVDPDVEIREIELGGVRKFVDGPEYELTKTNAAALKVIRDVKVKGKLLNLTASEAVALGMSIGIAPTREKALAMLGAPADAPVTAIPTSWSETFVGFITQGAVTGILISLGFIFVWVEMKAPGLGVPALAAAACFGLVFFGHYLVGLAEATEVIIFVVGAVLLTIECFTPGFGVAGVSGLLLIGVSLVLAVQNFVIPGNAYQWNSLGGNVLSMLASSGFAVLGFAIVVRFLPNTPMFNRIILKAELAPAGPAAEAILIGRTGIAITPLRPSGKIEVDGLVVDVVAEGGLVEPGTNVTVTKVDGPSIVVKRL